MPILKPPPDEIYLTLPPQKARLAAKTDVLVVGGGPAGIGAAFGAVNAGAEAVLVERYGFLGGNATAALVMPLMSFHTQYRHQAEGGEERYRLLPTDHGPGEAVISGALEEFLSQLVNNAGAVYPSRKTGYVVPFDPEVFKWTALQMLDEAGVTLLFHAFASGVRKEKGETQVVFQTKSGPVIIQAKAVVDCTGDGDIAYHAGAEYDVGRDGDHLLQPMTLMFRMGQFEPELFHNYVEEHPDQWMGVHGLWDLIEMARKKGELELAREDILFFATPHQREVSVNSTRIGGVSGISVWDLSRAEYETRRQMRQIILFLQKYVPGFSESYAVQSGVQIGVRETRRIRGVYTLTEDDVLSARKFPDAIARCTYPVDIHNPRGKGTILKRLPLGEAYDIPLRCLIPRNIDGILVAGRCISGTHEANSSFRVMPVCMATGQAAGVCAAMAVREQCYPGKVPAEDVQNELLEQGASLRKYESKEPR